MLAVTALFATLAVPALAVQSSRQARLEAEAVGLEPLSQAQMLKEFGHLLEQALLYHKTAYVLARPATPGESVETIVDGKVETRNTAKEGDMIVLNVNADGERYIAKRETFAKKYEDAGGEADEEGMKRYNPKGVIRAVEVSDTEMAKIPAHSFVAAWGEEMIVEVGDFLALPHPDGGEIYRIEKNAFGKTYAPMHKEH
mmetsp:Transcript_981/g.2492  ORF Transcript_981/g.2492 Transcript_981/m.2492 type:complete len:199 (+) Transcript_981:60-656(+)